MFLTRVLQLLTCWLLVAGLSGGLCAPAWAQGKGQSPKDKTYKPQGLDPGDGGDGGGGNTGSVSLRGSNATCIGTAVDFTAISSCGGFNWDPDGGAISRRTDTYNNSVVTVSWATAGTHVITVYASCSNNPTASITVTVTSVPTPGVITVPVGSASQVTATSATICQGNSVQLVPPAGSGNWTWTGANVLAVSSSGVATVQPFAEANTYALTYTDAGASCTTTSTFTVNVTPAPSLPVVATDLGGNWRLGAGSVTLLVKNPDPGIIYKWYDDPTSTTVLQTGPSYTPSVTQTRAYYVSATTCQETPRVGVAVTVRNLQLLVAGAVPTAPVRLPTGAPVVLQVSSPASGPFTWFLNGLQINNQSGSQLAVTQPGRYTVRVQYPADPYSQENASQPVDVIEGLTGQTANGQALTYLRDTQVLQAGLTTADQVAQLAPAGRLQRLTYLTGWAQPLQQLSVQAGPGQEDLVQHYAYAGSNTASQAYLPFAVSSQVKAAGLYEPDPVTKLNAYYAPVDAQPYATTTGEASPLDRPVSQAQTGSAWASHPDRVSYATNTAQDAVHLWQGLNGSAQYAAGQLMKEVLLDADNRRTEVYKDPLGRVVLQRKVTGYGGSTPQSFDTYSVYAPAGYLQYTLPPAAVAALAAANTWVVSSMPAGFADQWLYQYTYDDKGRLVERKFPGAAPVYLVYDKFDRPILVQDGTHRKAGVTQWLFTKFYAQNRAVVSGLYVYNNTAATARQDLQALADASPLTAEFEGRTSGGYSTDRTFPAVQDGSNGAVVLSQIFFDDYDLDQDASAQPDYAYAAQALGTSPQPVATAQVRGLQTMARTRVVQPNGQYGRWLTTVLFYDEYGNLIQKQSNNPLQTGSGLGDVTTLVYRQQGFVPQVLASLKTQQTAGLSGTASPVVSIRNRFSYDAAGRLLQTWQQHQWKNSWEPEVLVSSNTYSGLGELTLKQLHSRDGVKFLQNENFTYNLHGQLASINQSNLVSNPENDLFGLVLYREQAASPGNVPRYDGGITAASWSSYNAAQNNQPQRESSYVYAYDGLGRLTSATYAARTNPGAAWSLEPGAYDEKIGEYDANGNIKSIQRYTQASPTASRVLLDNLTFTYAGTGNQHSKVDDAGDATRGFRDATGSASEYDYDANGSITRDANKNVTYAYNALNKIERQAVGTGSLAYTYTAAGTLLQREITLNGVLTKTEYYVDGVVYQATPGAAGLLSVPTSEGRALVAAATDARLTYEYHLRDHLGNLRVAFREQAGTEDLRLSSENPSQEEGSYPKFQNVAATQSQGVRAYHGSYVAAVTSAKAGPAIAIPVADRDRIKVRVYYQTPAGVQTNAAPSPAPTMRTTATGLAVAPALLPVAPASAERPTRVAPGVQLSLTGLLSRLAASRQPTAQTRQATPLGSYEAYIRWTLLDANGQPVGGGTQAAPVTASSTTTWTKLDLPLTIDLSSVEARTGTLRIEEVNDGSQAVYFDSLTITHPQDRALVTQENHYYPLGMALSGVAVNTIPVATLSKEQFNEGSALQDELLGTEAGVYSTFYRTYDSATGRFTGVDPWANQYTAISTYQFGNNDPINYNDPSGAWLAGLGSFFSDLWDLISQNGGGGATVAVPNGDGTFSNRPLYPLGAPGEDPKRAGNNSAEYSGFYSFVNGGLVGGGDGTVTNTYSGVNSGMATGSDSGPTTALVGTAPPIFLLPRAIPWAGGAAAADGPIPIGDIVGAVLLTAAAAHDLYKLGTVYGPAVSAKMQREVARIRAKYATLTPPQGFVYQVEVTIPGVYTDVRGKPVTLKAGDIWKYGETTSGERYSPNELIDMAPGAGLFLRPLMYGNQMQIKIAEKFLIYDYFMLNYSLPPGNRIFR